MLRDLSDELREMADEPDVLSIAWAYMHTTASRQRATTEKS